MARVVTRPVVRVVGSKSFREFTFSDLWLGSVHSRVQERLMIPRNAFGPNGSVYDAVERHKVGSGQLSHGGNRRCRQHLAA
jgi:hypothetical protein